jgi:uncharacterized protein
VASPFRFLVADLLRDHGRRRPAEIVATVDWAIELSRCVPDTPVEADLTLEGTSGGVFVRGSVRAGVQHTCHRCLTEWQVPVAVEMAELVGGEGDYPMDGDEIDLEDPVRDALLLSLPLLPQCREDCLGLCSVCGADLNTGSCPGHDDEPEGPFSALRNLLEP